MLESIRSHKRLLMIILALFIIPGLGFFGIHGLSGMFSTADKVAKVDGQVIYKQQFEQVLREQINQMRQSLGGMDASLLDTPAIRLMLLEKIIDNLVINRETVNLHLTATDDAVKNQLMAFPWLQQLKQPDGSFDIPAYRAALKAHGLTPEEFDSQIRASLAQQQLMQTISSSAIVPKTLVQALLSQQTAQREIQTLTLSPNDFRQQLNPSDTDLNTFFNKNQPMFQIPEYADIEYVELNTQLIKTPSPSEQQLNEYYREHVRRFTKPEMIKTRHILISVDLNASDNEKKQALDKAENILREVNAQPDKFAEIAKQQSQDPGSAPRGGELGYSERGMMVKPFEEAAFALKVNQISNLVKSDFGYHIIQLLDRQPETVQPFDSVKSELTNELHAELSQKELADKKALFSQLINEHPDTLKAVADNLGLSIKHLSITRSGALASEKLSNVSPTQSQNEKNTLADNPKLIDAVFSDEVLNLKHNSQVIDIDANTVVAARVNTFHTVVNQPFQDVKAVVREKWLDEESLLLAEKTVKNYLNNPQLLSDKQFSSPKVISFDTAQELEGNAVRAIASIHSDQLQKGPAYVAARSEKNDITIYKINRIEQGKKVDKAIVESVNAQLKGLLSEVMWANYVNQLKHNISIKRYALTKPEDEMNTN